MRIALRSLMAATLAILFTARLSGGRFPLWIASPFYLWFEISVFVFGAFGLFAAYKAWRDPFNRRAYLLDVLLTAIWVPYWFSNLH